MNYYRNHNTPADINSQGTPKHYRRNHNTGDNINLQGTSKQLFCWKCLEEGVRRGFPLYKVKNSWVFACKEHKDLNVPDEAFSMETV